MAWESTHNAVDPDTNAKDLAERSYNTYRGLTKVEHYILRGIFKASPNLQQIRFSFFLPIGGLNSISDGVALHDRAHLRTFLNALCSTRGDPWSVSLRVLKINGMVDFENLKETPLQLQQWSNIIFSELHALTLKCYWARTSADEVEGSGFLTLLEGASQLKKFSLSGNPRAELHNSSSNHFRYKAFSLRFTDYIFERVALIHLSELKLNDLYVRLDLFEKFALSHSTTLKTLSLLIISFYYRKSVSDEHTIDSRSADLSFDFSDPDDLALFERTLASIGKTCEQLREVKLRQLYRTGSSIATRSNVMQPIPRGNVYSLAGNIKSGEYSYMHDNWEDLLMWKRNKTRRYVHSRE